MITEHQSYNIANGTEVKAEYCGSKVSAIVIDSRCMYGIRKQYSLELLGDLIMPWGTRKAGDTLLVDNTEILEICN